MSSRINYTVIGSKLKDLRIKNGLTQEQVASSIGISRDRLGSIERGIRKITLEDLYSLAQLYNFNIDDIIFNISPEDVKNFKGIILAGGSGTRLYPITKGLSKQVVNIYDKPMIYYPLSVLMSAGIKDILIITTPQDQYTFKKLLEDGRQFGVNIEYAIQPSPDGLAQAFIIGEKFIGDNPCAMVLGDNIFYGSGMRKGLNQAVINAREGFATIFGNQVRDPERFGIMELDAHNNVIGVEEKPTEPKSEWAITGLYFYPKGVAEFAKRVTPSARGELEITSLNDMYLQEQKLKAILMQRGDLWYDTGTRESLRRATDVVATIEEQTDSIICCPEAIGYEKGWISQAELLRQGELMAKNEYGQYLLKLAKEGRR